MSDSEKEEANVDAEEEKEEQEEKEEHDLDATGDGKAETNWANKIGSGKQLLEDAKTCKEVGLGAYKVNDYKKAVECWMSAHNQLKLLFEEKLFSEGDPEHAEASSLADVLSLNLAQVHLKEGSFHQALESCETVLAKEPQNAKALYRKASAQLMASDFPAARSTANAWLQLDPDNADARQLLSKIVKEEKGSKAAAQKAAKRMFGGIEHDPRTVNPPPRQKDVGDLLDGEEMPELTKNEDGSYTLDGGEAPIEHKRPRSAFTDEQWKSFFRTLFFCCRRKPKKD